MNSWWYALAAEMPKSDCERILNLYRESANQTGKVGQSKKNEEIRKSKVVGFPYGSSYAEDINDTIGRYINLANRECYGFNLNGVQEFQIAEYNVGNFYDEHMDATLTDNLSQRKLSITVQLTNPVNYDGGDFIFTKGIITPSQIELKQQGTILIFPSFIYHKILPVTRGTRYSLVGWYEGNKWR